MYVGTLVMINDTETELKLVLQVNKAKTTEKYTNQTKNLKHVSIFSHAIKTMTKYLITFQTINNNIYQTTQTNIFCKASQIKQTVLITIIRNVINIAHNLTPRAKIVQTRIYVKSNTHKLMNITHKSNIKTFSTLLQL